MRYVTVQDIQDTLELGTLDNTNDPKLRLVESWINAAEEAIDLRSNQRWDYHLITNELVSPKYQTNEFAVKVRPLHNIQNLYYQAGDEWTPDWVAIPSTDYKISNSHMGRFRTKEYFWKTESLKISYEGGYLTIPEYIKELAKLEVEKRYIMSRLSISAGEVESISIAVIRLVDKSDASLKYRLTGLEREINDRYAMLGKLNRADAYDLGYSTVNTGIRYWS